MKNTSD